MDQELNDECSITNPTEHLRNPPATSDNVYYVRFRTGFSLGFCGFMCFEVSKRLVLQSVCSDALFYLSLASRWIGAPAFFGFSDMIDTVYQ